MGQPAEGRVDALRLALDQPHRAGWAQVSRAYYQRWVQGDVEEPALILQPSRLVIGTLKGQSTSSVLTRTEPATMRLPRRCQGLVLTKTRSGGILGSNTARPAYLKKKAPPISTACRQEGGEKYTPRRVRRLARRGAMQCSERVLAFTGSAADRH